VGHHLVPCCQNAIVLLIGAYLGSIVGPQEVLYDACGYLQPQFALVRLGSIAAFAQPFLSPIAKS
jgi:hypothetical protein